MKKMIYIIITILFILIGVALYSRFLGTKGLIVKEYGISTNEISNNFHGLKIAHISDIHYGRTTKIKDLKNMVKEINKLKPDIVVLTGDFFDNDSEIKELDQIIDVMNEIDVTLGKYAITGNHDLFVNNWESFIDKIGFTNLNDTYDLVYYKDDSPILISGLSSNTNNKINASDRIKPTMDYLESLDGNIYSILLTHEPDYIDTFNYKAFDLILAGHSHNGQINLPLIKNLILPDGSKKYYKNYYSLGNTDLYISSGIGCSTLNFRLFNKPSINFYRIQKIES